METDQTEALYELSSTQAQIPTFASIGGNGRHNWSYHSELVPKNIKS